MIAIVYTLLPINKKIKNITSMNIYIFGTCKTHLMQAGVCSKAGKLVFDLLLDKCIRIK